MTYISTILYLFRIIELFYCGKSHWEISRCSIKTKKYKYLLVYKNHQDKCSCNGDMETTWETAKGCRYPDWKTGFRVKFALPRDASVWTEASKAVRGEEGRLKTQEANSGRSTTRHRPCASVPFVFG